jgi:hypothetical protein
MTTYGSIAIFMTLLSITMAYLQSPTWLIGGGFSAYLAWTLNTPTIFGKYCTQITTGKVLDIKKNGTFLGGYHQPLYNAKIAYLDRIKIFKNLPPGFSSEVSVGSLIEIKFNPKNRNIAFVNYE